MPRFIWLCLFCATSLVLLGGTPRSSRGLAEERAEPAVFGKTAAYWRAQLADENESARLAAAAALARLGPAAAPEIFVLLESQAPALRRWGAVGMAQIAGAKDAPEEARQRALAALERALLDPAATVRIAAAAALAEQSPNRAALNVLVEALQDPIDGARIEAASALHDLGESARPALSALREARRDKSEYVVRLATRAVARLEASAP